MAGPHNEAGAQSPGIAEIMRSRRTIHDFQAVPISDDVILEAIESARWAPNHRLSEPWNFYLVGQKTAAEIAQLNYEIVREKRGEQAARAKLRRWLSMPAWFVVTCKRSDSELRHREDYAACCCAIQNLFLHLWSEGVGTKWATGAVTRDPRFYDLIGADINSEDVVGLCWYGIPAENPGSVRVKSVSEITKRLD